MFIIEEKKDRAIFGSHFLADFYRPSYAKVKVMIYLMAYLHDHVYMYIDDEN